MVGNEMMNAEMTAGRTNMPACVNISPTKPSFVRPTSRITPNSNDFDSTEISSSENTSKMDTTMKIISRTLKISPMNITSYWKLARPAKRSGCDTAL